MPPGRTTVKSWNSLAAAASTLASPLNRCLNDKWELCPLLILLAIGNGQGGGDYHGTNMDKVGTWAFHKIKVYYEEPHWMEKLENIFEENLR